MQPDRLGTSEWTPPSDFSARYPYADGKFWIGRSPTDDTAIGYDDDRHICLVSGNRGGKGTATIIPNLCLWPGSAIIIDPKGENATITAARRGPGSADCEGMGQRVYVLDPFEKAQVDSSLRGRFNPFDALDPDNPRTIDDAAKLADSIVVTNPESKDPFWDESARAMVRALILHVLTSPDFEGRRNLLTLREIVLHGDRLRAEKLRELGETNIPNSQSLLWHGVSKNESFNGVVSGIGTRFRDMSLSSAKQFDSVLQVVDRNTEFLDSPGMRSVLEASDFSLRDLKTDPKGVSVYLSLPQSFMNTHFRWLRMMLALFVAEMEHVPGNKGANGHRILVCMDEFAGLRRMEFIETAVSQIAGFGVKLFFVLQSLEQLKATYEKSWETFLANAGIKLFYSVGDQFTRKYISEYIGDTEITREMKSVAEMNGWNTGESWGSSTSESEQHSTTASTNWGTSTNESQSASGGSSDSWESMPLFLRNTGGFFAGLTGNRGASRNSGWQEGSGTGTQSGGSESENVGGSRTTTENEGGSRGESGSSTITHSENLHKRPLITPDEIGRYFGRIDAAEDPFYPGCSLVLIEGKQPAVVRKSNYFQDRAFSRLFEPHPDYGNFDIGAHEVEKSVGSKLSTSLTAGLVPITTVAVHHSWKRIASSDALPWVKNNRKWTPGLHYPVAVVVWSPDGTRLMTTHSATDANVWTDQGVLMSPEPQDRALRARHPKTGGGLRSAHWSSDGVILLNVGRSSYTVFDRDGAVIYRRGVEIEYLFTCPSLAKNNPMRPGHHQRIAIRVSGSAVKMSLLSYDSKAGDPRVATHHTSSVGEEIESALFAFSVTDGARVTGMSWHPSGDLLAIIIDHSHVHIVDWSKPDVVMQIAHAARDPEPLWSPGGQLLKLNGTTVWDIKSDNVRPMTEEEGTAFWGAYSSPRGSTSADGRYIAVQLKKYGPIDIALATTFVDKKWALTQPPLHKIRSDAFKAYCAWSPSDPSMLAIMNGRELEIWQGEPTDNKMS